MTTHEPIRAMMTMTTWIVFQLGAPEVVGLWEKATWAAQVIAIPLLTAILVFVYDTWRKSIAVYAEVFGNPNKKDDRGLVGQLDTHDEEIGRLFVATDTLRHRP